MSRCRNNPDLLTPAEAAKSLGAQTEAEIDSLRETIVKLVRAGQIHDSGNGQVVRIHRDDVELLRSRMGLEGT